MDNKYLRMQVEACHAQKESASVLFDIRKDNKYFIITVYDKTHVAKLRCICNKEEHASIILGRPKLTFSVKCFDQLMVDVVYHYRYDITKFNKESLTDETEESVVREFVDSFELEENGEWYEAFTRIQARIRDKRIVDKHWKTYKNAKAFERKNLRVPNLGNSFCTALKRALPDCHTSYYEKCGDQYQSVCPCCGKLIKRKSAKHNEKIICSKCGESLLLQNKNFFKKRDGYIGKDLSAGYFLWFHKHEKKVIGRLFFIRRGTEAKTFICETNTVEELARIVYQRNFDGTLNIEIYNNFHDRIINKRYFRKSDNVKFKQLDFFCRCYAPQDIDVNFSNFKRVFKATGILGNKLLTILNNEDRRNCYIALYEIHKEPWTEKLIKYNLKNVFMDKAYISYFGLYSHRNLYSELNKLSQEPLTSFFEKIGVTNGDIPFIINNGMNISEIDCFVAFLRKGIRMNQTELECLRHENLILNELADCISHDFRIIPLINYLKRERSDQNEKLSDLLVILKDYWSLSKKLFKDLSSSQVRYPKDLKKIHDEYNELVENNKIILKKQALENIPNIYSKYKDIFSYEGRNFKVFPLRSSEDCLRESQALKNCIYNNYAVAYGRDETILLAVRETNNPSVPFYDVEIKDFQVRQYQGYNNQGNEKREKVKKFLDSFMIHVHKKLFSTHIGEKHE